jgi:hypothetical protein
MSYIRIMIRRVAGHITPPIRRCQAVHLRKSVGEMGVIRQGLGIC